MKFGINYYKFIKVSDNLQCGNNSKHKVIILTKNISGLKVYTDRFCLGVFSIEKLILRTTPELFIDIV